MLRIKIYIHLYIILDFPITYENASVICQPDCACLHKTVNMEVFFVKSNENTYPKGRALMQMYKGGIAASEEPKRFKWED